jgi:uncharacterized protein (TIGR00730 family)
MPDSASSRPATGLRSVCVYCGSSDAARTDYLDLASRLGAELGQRRIRLVYGGGGVGLMGRCARAAHAAGGDVLGVMPRFLARREIVLQEVTHRMVDTMHERKKILFDEADAFIALPGGIGTLEEVVETLSWARLDLHAKPVVFLAEDGFWAPFFHLVQHTIDANMTPAAFGASLMHANSVDDCLDALEARVGAQA